MQIRKVLSVILIVSILFSVTTIGFSSSVSAQTINTYSTEVSLTFDGDAPYGFPAQRGDKKYVEYKTDEGYAVLSNSPNSGATIYIGQDGTVGQNQRHQWSSSAQKTEAKNSLFYCQPGKTYRLKFDFKYLAGSGGISKTVNLFLVPDPTASSISKYNLADRATLVDSKAATVDFGKEMVLTEDTDWATAYYTFTIKETLDDGSAAQPVSIGIHPGYSASYYSYLAVDNLTVSEVSSFEYNESRLHTMDDATQDAFVTASGCNDGTALVDYDETHGKVLKLNGGSNARLSFDDCIVKKDRLYYIYFDAKSETDNAKITSLIGAKGSSTTYRRFFFTGFQTNSSGVTMYVDGNKVGASDFLFSTEWQRYGMIIDTCDTTMMERITQQGSTYSTFWNSTNYFLFGTHNATVYFDNFQLIEVDTMSNAVPDETKIQAAASIRVEKLAENNNGTYQSAGLRFNGIIDNSVKAASDEIGFIVAPSSSVLNDSDWYKLESGLNSIARTAACYIKGSKDIIYEEGTTQTAYQMILTGLSTEDGKTAYKRRFSAVMYSKSGDSYTYYALGEISYKQVLATYNVMNIDYEKPPTESNLLVIDDSWKSHPQDYKLIAFTFDDGPKDTDGEDKTNNATKMIDTLNKYGGAGTMFVIGSSINTYGVGQLQYAIDNGFEIASHTYTHANINSSYLTNRPDYTAQDYIDEQIKPLNDLLKQELNYEPKFLRASNGTCPQQVIDAAAEMNMPLVFGNQDENGKTVATGDYKDTTTAKEVYDAIVNSAYDGKVVLMHHTDCSAEALDDICIDLYIQGYRFVTLSELFEYKLKVTDMSQVDVAASFGGSSGIYDIDDVELKYYNEDQWFLHPEDYKLIAFTFDDGPVYSTVGDNVVTRVIDSFEDYYGAATFFFTGRSLSTYGTTIPKYALSKGHELGNHSYNHATLYDITDKQQTVDEIKKVNDWYLENMNYDCKWFRGAGFSYNDDMWDYLTSIGMPAINYAVSQGGDYSGGTATVDSILNSLLNKEIKEGSIIIGHSTKSDGVVPDALAIALPILYEQGYRFCTLTQLFELQGIEYEDIPTGKYIKGVTVENGVAVYSFN